MTSLVPHTLTASQVSVTKAGGLNNAPDAERLPNGKDEDTVTYISNCTVGGSQLVRRQHTCNIKCMMGYVTWYTPSPWEGTAPPPRKVPPTRQVYPQYRYTPTDRYNPWQVHPPGRYTPSGQGQPPGQVHPRAGTPPMVNERAVSILLECILVS